MSNTKQTKRTASNEKPSKKTEVKVNVERLNRKIQVLKGAKHMHTVLYNPVTKRQYSVSALDKGKNSESVIAWGYLGKLGGSLHHSVPTYKEAIEKMIDLVNEKLRTDVNWIFKIRPTEIQFIGKDSK